MDVNDFQSLCKDVVATPEFQPTPDGTTHCNQGLTRIAREFGVDNFEGKLANQLIDQISQDPKWAACDADEAWNWAMQGNLAIACVKEAVHGHVATIYPAEKVASGKWGMSVPQVANVGKKNEIFGENFAFHEPPQHFKYIG